MLLNSRLQLESRDKEDGTKEHGITLQAIPYGSFVDDRGTIAGSLGHGVLHVSENPEQSYHAAMSMRASVHLIGGKPYFNLVLHFPLTYSLVNLPTERDAEGNEIQAEDYSLCPDPMLNAGMALYRDYKAGLADAPGLVVAVSRGEPLRAVESYVIEAGNSASAPCAPNADGQPAAFYIALVMADTDPLRLMRIPSDDTTLPPKEWRNWFGLRDEQQAALIGVAWVNVSESDPEKQFHFRPMVEILQAMQPREETPLLVALKAAGVKVVDLN